MYQDIELSVFARPNCLEVHGYNAELIVITMLNLPRKVRSDRHSEKILLELVGTYQG